MNSKPVYVALILLSLSVVGFTQNVYTLHDCIAIGLEKNFSILISGNNEEIAANNYTPGNAGYLPTIDLSGSQTGTLNNTTQHLDDGSTNVTGSAFNTSNNAGVNLGLTIFNGFKVRTTYQKLYELKQIGALNTQLSVENLIADIVSGYYNYILQVQLLHNLQYAVVLSKARLRIDEDRYLLGSSSRLQVLQSRVYLNADSANLTKQNEVVRAAEVNLNELLAIENLDQSFVARDTSINVMKELSYDTLLNETLLNNTQLQIANKDKSVSEYDYRIATSRSYPYLNFSSGYNYALNTYGLGSTKSQVVNGMRYNLTLGINLFDGLNQRRVITNSKIEVQNKELMISKIEQGVRADLINLYFAYSNSIRLITMEKQNLGTATENLDIAMERYKLGDLSGLDLREVQKSLLDARESLLSVQYQAKLAEISLLLISGKIMSYYQ